jgi:flagellar biosynthesis/type III secretory pathway chaperone
MNDALPHLIESLREELRQYGQMLVLLEDQQEGIVRRQNEALLDATSAVNAQGAAIQAARSQRETIQRELATQLHTEQDPSLAGIAPLLPPDYRPLLTALVQENNNLLRRVQQRARQNYLLLRRSLELLDQFLHTLAPVGPPVYDGAGSLQTTPPGGAALYEALG